ncbi:MAG: hypothetical protein ACXABY_20870 [Candidatus Thorarchaeota archaeon]|jgi:hypothetical protein
MTVGDLFHPDPQSPEGLVGYMLNEGRITTQEASDYLTSISDWRTNHGSYLVSHQGKWVGRWNGVDYVGTSITQVVDAMNAADPNNKGYVDFVSAPSSV